MTVENETSKTAKMVMGSQTYDFFLDVLLEDPTEDEAKQAICCVVSDGVVENELVYGVDYTVELNKDKKGGVVTVTDPKDNGWTIIIYRKYKSIQSSDYNDYSSFPAETLEANLDKITMVLQQHEEELGRSVKTGMTSDINPEEVLGSVERVYSSIDSIDTVAENIVGVNTVANNTEALNTVADNIENVNNTGESIESVNTVANSISSVDTVSANINSVVDAVNQANIAATSAGAAAISETNAKQSELLAAAYAERVRSEGIPMSIIEQRRIEKDGNTVKLWWKDPKDTIIDGFVLASWKSTTIVKKRGSYPEDVNDGTVVGIYTTRDQFFTDPLIDTQSDAENWYYRAFPLSVNGVYCLDKRNCFGAVLFGYRINEVDPVPSTRVEYLPYCDNAFYDPCVMDFVADQFNWGSWEKAFFIPRPCALTYDGVVDYYLNVNNFALKEDGTASDVSDSSYGGNFMVEFPSIFVKTWKENNYINVLVSNVKMDDEFECWATKKSDGTYAPNFYLPMFEGTNVSNKLRSIATTGKPTGGLTAEVEAAYATANGSGWNTTTWADELLMILLFPLLFKSTDSQSVLGYGASASTSALTVNNNAAIAKGLMYGTRDASSYGVNYLGMHNWYGHRWRRPNGLMNASGNIKVKMTHSTIDGSTVEGYNRSGEGYISTGFVPPEASESYINRYEPVGKYGLFPKATSGSSTTFYCDAMWTNNGQLDQLILGGAVASGALRGVFCFHVNDLPTNTSWGVGSSPSYHRL